MRRSARRLLTGVGAVAGAGALALSMGGTALASQARPAGPASMASRASSRAVTDVNGLARTVGAARTAAWVPPRRVLWMGDRGRAVRRIQARLKQLKYYPGPVDGFLGTDTMEAIWAFRAVQRQRLTASTADEISLRTEREMVHPRLPRVLNRRGGASRIEINQYTEVLVLYKHGKISLISHVSTGGGYLYPCPPPGSGTCGPAITPDGNYRAHWFAAGWVKVPLGEMYNPVFFIGGAYAIHGDNPVPWYPASHGCVRIPMDIASWFHRVIHISESNGIPIYIRGKAPYFLV